MGGGRAVVEDVEEVEDYTMEETTNNEDDFNDILKALRHNIDRLERARDNLDEDDPRRQESILEEVTPAQNMKRTKGFDNSGTHSRFDKSSPIKNTRDRTRPGIDDGDMMKNGGTLRSSHREIQHFGMANTPFYTMKGSMGFPSGNNTNDSVDASDDISVGSENSNVSYIPVPFPVYMPPPTLQQPVNVNHYSPLQSPYMFPGAGYPGIKTTPSQFAGASVNQQLQSSLSRADKGLSATAPQTFPYSRQSAAMSPEQREKHYNGNNNILKNKDNLSNGPDWSSHGEQSGKKQSVKSRLVSL